MDPATALVAKLDAMLKLDLHPNAEVECMELRRRVTFALEFAKHQGNHEFSCVLFSF